MTDVDWDELSRLFDAATPGDWRISRDTPLGWGMIQAPPVQDIAIVALNPAAASNAAFIVALHNAFPAIRERVRELEANDQFGKWWEAENATLVAENARLRGALRAVQGLGAIPSTQPEYRLIEAALAAPAAQEDE